MASGHNLRDSMQAFKVSNRLKQNKAIEDI